MCHLELKFPNHFCDDPYPLEDVRAATEFMLQGTDSSVIQPSPVEKKSIAMKPEDLQTFMEMFAKTIVNAIGNRGAPAQRQQVSFARPLVPEGKMYHYCGAQDHYLRDCPECVAAIETGKCKKNAEGKLVLPSGSFVPCQIPGIYIRDHVEEWHR